MARRVGLIHSKRHSCAPDLFIAGYWDLCHLCNLAELMKQQYVSSYRFPAHGYCELPALRAVFSEKEQCVWFALWTTMRFVLRCLWRPLFGTESSICTQRLLMGFGWNERRCSSRSRFYFEWAQILVFWFRVTILLLRLFGVLPDCKMTRSSIIGSTSHCLTTVTTCWIQVAL